MKAILLAGGLGTRMREETEFRPKPMVEVGGQPILWHIMKNLSQFGITDFIIASGYKSEVINEYFLSHSEWSLIEKSEAEDSSPDHLDEVLRFAGSGDQSSWTVNVAFTGDSTNTGGRVSRLGSLVRDSTFFVTYGDGLADVNMEEVIRLHNDSGALATLTAVQPTSRFGLMDIDDEGRVTHFREKPRMKDWVSIGYFIFEPAVLDYLNDDCGLEEDGLARLAADGQLNAYQHEGFWQPMDTFREYTILQELWETGDAPWKMW